MVMFHSYVRLRDGTPSVRFFDSGDQSTKNSWSFCIWRNHVTRFTRLVKSTRNRPVLSRNPTDFAMLDPKKGESHQRFLPKIWCRLLIQKDLSHIQTSFLSGKLTVCHWQLLFAVDFPIKNASFPEFLECLPEVNNPGFATTPSAFGWKKTQAPSHSGDMHREGPDHCCCCHLLMVVSRFIMVDGEDDGE